MVSLVPKTLPYHSTTWEKTFFSNFEGDDRTNGEEFKLKIWCKVHVLVRYYILRYILQSLLKFKICIMHHKRAIWGFLALLRLLLRVKWKYILTLLWSIMNFQSYDNRSLLNSPPQISTMGKLILASMTWNVPLTL